MRARLVSWSLALGAACTRAPLPPPAPDLTALDPAVAELLAERLEAVRAKPDDGPARGAFGLACEANELWREAEPSFAAAAELEPGEPSWRYHRALALAALGRSTEALVILRELEQALPDAAYVAQRRGELALGEGAFEEARTAFEHTIALAPEAAEGYTGLGAAQLALGQLDAAATALERAVALDPGYKSAHYQLGLVQRQRGKLAEAERELALGQLGRVRYLPDPLASELRHLAVAGAARLQLALALLEEGRAERAARVLENLRTKDPADVALLNNLAIAWQRAGDRGRARQYLEEARALDPAVLSTWINLAMLALEENTAASALECAQHAVELAPESAKAQLALGRVLLRQGRAEEALAALARARRSDPRELDALWLSAEAWLARDEPDEARACYATLAAERPDDARTHVGLAEVALRQGQRAEAERELGAALALDPNHPEVVALREKLTRARE